MSQEKNSQMWLEVAELKRLLGDAAKVSPELWAAIQQSVNVAELVPNSIQAEATQGTEISSGAETTSLNQVEGL